MMFHLHAEQKTDTLEREFDQLLADLKVTREQIRVYIENKDHFTDDNWEEIEKQKQELDQKLLLQLKNIVDPLKAKKSLQERKDVKPQWLFVR